MTVVRCLEWEKKVAGLRFWVGTVFCCTPKSALTHDDPSDHHRFFLAAMSQRLLYSNDMWFSNDRNKYVVVGERERGREGEMERWR